MRTARVVLVGRELEPSVSSSSVGGQWGKAIPVKGEASTRPARAYLPALPPRSPAAAACCHS